MEVLLSSQKKQYPLEKKRHFLMLWMMLLDAREGKYLFSQKRLKFAHNLL